MAPVIASGLLGSMTAVACIQIGQTITIENSALRLNDALPLFNDAVRPLYL